MAAASAVLRGLEGNFTNNIRAGERFLTMIPGVGDALQTAFPAVGAIVLGVALVKLADEAYHGYQNVVLLKGALEGLGSLDITVGKKVQQAADQAESSLERVLEATQGKAAAQKQKLAYQGRKGIDLSDYFYSKEYKDLPTNVKADYESNYKAIAPTDIPERLSKITTEIKALKKEMANPGADSTLAGFGSRVGIYGPSALQDAKSYYKARISAATQIQQLLQAENQARSGKLDEIGVEGKNDPKAKAAVSDNPIGAGPRCIGAGAGKGSGCRRTGVGSGAAGGTDAQHKLFLVSDLDYYQKKFDLADAEATAEQNAITAQTKQLQNLQARQRADKLLKRDKDGNSKEEYETARKLVELGEKQAALSAKEKESASRYSAEVGTTSNAAELAGLRVAAALERERGSGIEAQIKLLEREHELEAQKSTLAGGSDADAKAIRDSGVAGRAEAKAEGHRRRHRAGGGDPSARRRGHQRRAGEGRHQQANGGQRTKAANAKEMEDLRSLAKSYRDLAEAIGDPALIGKAQDLDQQLANLGRTDRRGTFGKEVQDGLQGITTSIIDSAARGKQSFADMAKSILGDLDRLALKLAEERVHPAALEAGFGAAAGAREARKRGTAADSAGRSAFPRSRQTRGSAGAGGTKHLQAGTEVRGWVPEWRARRRGPDRHGGSGQRGEEPQGDKQHHQQFVPASDGRRPADPVGQRHPSNHHRYRTAEPSSRWCTVAGLARWLAKNPRGHLHPWSENRRNHHRDPPRAPQPPPLHRHPGACRDAQRQSPQRLPGPPRPARPHGRRGRALESPRHGRRLQGRMGRPRRAAEVRHHRTRLPGRRRAARRGLPLLAGLQAAGSGSAPDRPAAGHELRAGGRPRP